MTEQCTRPPAELSLTDTEFLKCPFEGYQSMRDERPIFQDPITGFYVATRYQDVKSILLNHKDWSSRCGQLINRSSEISDEITTMYEQHGWLPIDTLVTNDQPEHKRYRGLVDRVFSRDSIPAIQPKIDEIVEKLLDNVIGKGPVNFVEEVAVPIPLLVIADQLGVDPNDMPKFKRWTVAIMEGVDPVLSPERERVITRSTIELQNYLAGAIERYRADKGSNILSHLVHAEVDGDRLNVQEIIAIATMLMVGGHDTTASSLSSAMLHLAENPAVFDLLATNPSKVEKFVEEVLRVYAPVQRLFRRAKRDLTIGGVDIPKDTLIVIQYGGANRDERQFAEAEVLDLERGNTMAHLAFGAGIHFCIGNQLARTEINTTIRMLLKRATGVQLANGSDSIERLPSPTTLSFGRLDVAIYAKAA